jgi:hypothetical protein
MRSTDNSGGTILILTIRFRRLNFAIIGNQPTLKIRLLAETTIKAKLEIIAKTIISFNFELGKNQRVVVKNLLKIFNGRYLNEE